jgi:methylmalonyl-CoA mutase N-terminal domain/subunit
VTEPSRRNPALLPVSPLYGPADWHGDPGPPGEWPYLRGVQPSMYTGRLWTMRQYAGFGTAEETNRRFRALLEAGQTGLSTAFDLPTQMGYDSDHPMAVGEVGRVGVAIDSVEDLARLFEEIPLDQVSTSMTINATAGILLAMYIVIGEERGIARTRLSGTIQNDILKEYIARGTYIFPAEPSLRLVADIFGFVASEGMSVNPISISGYHMREAGATAVQEVAFTLSNACEYVGRALRQGLRIEQFGPRPTTICSRKPPNSGRPGGSGPGWRGSGSRPTTRPASSGSTPRPAGSPSRRSSRSTTWCG